MEDVGGLSKNFSDRLPLGVVPVNMNVVIAGKNLARNEKNRTNVSAVLFFQNAPRCGMNCVERVAA